MRGARTAGAGFVAVASVVAVGLADAVRPFVPSSGEDATPSVVEYEFGSPPRSADRRAVRPFTPEAAGVDETVVPVDLPNAEVRRVRVVDAKGVPVAGVAVRTKAPSAYRGTDEQGVAAFEVAPDATVVAEADVGFAGTRADLDQPVVVVVVAPVREVDVIAVECADGRSPVDAEVTSVRTGVPKDPTSASRGRGALRIGVPILSPGVVRLRVRAGAGPWIESEFAVSRFAARARLAIPVFPTAPVEFLATDAAGWVVRRVPEGRVRFDVSLFGVAASVESDADTIEVVLRAPS